ncbi:TIGR01777 family oxidoreductase [Cytophagaceae bacterium YF14B1]|uniref:TIGR01777 family oxidoreductase n=1 Tax=Xanthocytophaga flava TaxID=3048013 RepID=A0AAE3U8R6_9BACT|nr:TIGR01777 family oxidoreductase [Xanthocytophaga flavus]MDJ1484304.1 TIGR01777 family oxidoreductase [Xanthocytophaga flavus]
MSAKVLITGGTGLVGNRLTELLQQKGYQVSIVSRKKENIPNLTVYQWDVRKQYIEPGAVESADYIIHLAGAGVADERWTDERKKEIIESRTESARLIHDTIQKTGHKPKAFVSASGISIYGDDRGDELLTETSSYASTFLAEVSKVWEASAQTIADLGIRTVMLRIGIVLSDKGGALVKMTAPVKLGVGAALGSGKQWTSWIHIDDLCRMIIHAMENEQLSGAYNAVGPHPDTNKELIRVAAQTLKRPLFLPNVPAFALKLLVGQLADTVLGSLKISNQKIAQTGFTYQFPDLSTALKDLFHTSG